MSYVGIITHSQLVISKKWVWNSFFKEIPVDFTIYKDSIFIVALKASSQGVVIYRISMNGDMVWRNTWSPSGNVSVYPLGIHVVGNKIVIPVLYNDRHNIVILSYSLDGMLIESKRIALRPIIWVYDVEFYIDGSIILVGTRYVIGKRLEFYVSRLNSSSFSFYWEKTWGDIDIDYLVNGIVSRDGLIYVWGNSSTLGSTLACIDGTGELLWSTSIGDSSIVSMKVASGRIILLTRNDTSYMLVKIPFIAPKNISKEPIDVTGFSNVQLHDVYVDDDILLIAGSSYNNRTGSIDAFIPVYVEKRLDKIIWSSTNGTDGFLKVNMINNTIFGLGFYDTRIFLAAYSLGFEKGVVIEPAWYAVLIIGIVILISVFYIHRKRLGRSTETVKE